jgi:hypothetical protein
LADGDLPLSEQQREFEEAVSNAEERYNIPAVEVCDYVSNRCKITYRFITERVSGLLADNEPTNLPTNSLVTNHVHGTGHGC